MNLKLHANKIHHVGTLKQTRERMSTQITAVSVTEQPRHPMRKSLGAVIHARKLEMHMQRKAGPSDGEKMSSNARKKDIAPT